MTESTENNIPNPFTTLVIWQGTVLKDEEIPKMIAWFGDMGYRIKFMESTSTLPDRKNGVDVPNTGNRTDVLFYIHSEDISRFSIFRVRTNDMKWWHDMDKSIYTNEIRQKYK